MGSLFAVIGSKNYVHSYSGDLEIWEGCRLKDPGNIAREEG